MQIILILLITTNKTGKRKADTKTCSVFQKITLLFQRSFCDFFSAPFSGADLETLNPAGGVNHFVIASVKRVAGAADFNRDFFFGGTNGKSIAAGAGYFGVWEIGRVDLFLHTRTIPKSPNFAN